MQRRILENSTNGTVCDLLYVFSVSNWENRTISSFLLTDFYNNGLLFDANLRCLVMILVFIVMYLTMKYDYRRSINDALKHLLHLFVTFIFLSLLFCKLFNEARWLRKLLSLNGIIIYFSLLSQSVDDEWKILYWQLVKLKGPLRVWCFCDWCAQARALFLVDLCIGRAPVRFLYQSSLPPWIPPMNHEK